jgi:hypothetical protein
MTNPASLKDVAAAAAKSWFGETIAARHYDGTHQWAEFLIGEIVSDTGGSSSVWQVSTETEPPLLVKLYKGEMLKRLRTDAATTTRLYPLVRSRRQLSADLPFAVWPRRLVFTDADVTEGNFADKLLGFTMARLDITTSLNDLVEQDKKRTRMSAGKTRHILLLVMDYLQSMHEHPWQFMFGDMSLHNIHVSRDRNRVYFIDTDAFQYTDSETDKFFAVPGMTEGFRSPGTAERHHDDPLPNTHDTFVMAIIIFMMLMADMDAHGAHPFSAAGHDADELIDGRIFPYEDSNNYPISDYVLKRYRAMPAELRQAFLHTFTTTEPVSLTQWRMLLQKHWSFAPAFGD